MTWTSWLPPLVAILFLCALAGWLAWLNHQNQTMWMRIFCAERHLPPTTMETKRDAPVTLEPKPTPRHRVSIPIPGASLWSKTSAQKTA